ncbi:unnamed protein product, partial [Rotaria magnacalcarata]
LYVEPLALGTHLPPLRHGDGIAGFVGHGGIRSSQRVPEYNVELHMQA